VGVRGGSLSDFVAHPSGDRFDWEAEGRRLGETLDDYGCLIVVGPDATTTTLTALGIARTQAARRRVAVGDLFGDAPPLHQFVQPDDTHGLVDAILHGVSLNRVAIPAEENEQLFILPTGTESPDSEEILGNPRWKRIVAMFRETDALLLVAVPVTAPGLEQLVAVADGAIVVGKAVPSQLSIADILGSVREPTPAATTAPPRVPQFEARGRLGPKRVRDAIAGVSLNARQLWGLGGSLLALVLAGFALWIALHSGDEASNTAARRATDSANRQAALVRRTDSMTGRTDSAAGSTGSRLVPTPTNPDDSANAASFAVTLVSSNTPRGAILRLQKDASRLPAATFAPVVINGVTWFQLRAGAFTSMTQADSLIRWMQRSGGTLDSLGRKAKAVRAPYAFLLDTAVQAAAVQNLLASYAQLNRPAYALWQRSGKFNVYVGAFQTPEEAMQLADQLRAAGLDVPLVYRTGRVY